MKRKYTLNGLDCPNCAAKIEREVAALPAVSSATVDLMTQSLTVEAAGEEAALTAAITTIVHAHEPEVTVQLAGAKSIPAGGDDGSVIGRVWRLVGGGVVFVAALMLLWQAFPKPVWLTLLVAAYILLGCDVVWRAIRNIGKGQVFDENFLMSLSSIGAFVIGEYPEAVAVMLFYQVGELCQDLAVRRSRRRIAALMDIRPDEAVVWRDDTWQTVTPEAVAVGEHIRVVAGEKLPLDGVVVEGFAALDTKALTGEALPREVGVGDEVLSGCIDQSGVLTVEVTKPFAQSTVSKILELVENASARKARTEQFITAFARVYTPIVVALAVLLALLPPLFVGDFAQWIHRGFVFLVISCPCALVISVPLSFFGGIGAASAQGILVKGGNVLEALARVSTAVFDKTGTLTKGAFAVSAVCPAALTREELLSLAAAAERFSTHPIARCIASAGESDVVHTAYEELAGKGVRAQLGRETVLVGNAVLMAENGVKIVRPEQDGTVVYVAKGGVFGGCIVVADAVKADSAEAIALLRASGVRTVMLTGDSPAAAAAVADTIGIDEVKAGLLPAQKVEQVEALRTQLCGGTIAFVGDGINDAPVLALADVGVAMGGVGADAAVEAADVVLMTDEPSKFVQAIAIARRTGAIARQNIVLTLIVKVLFLILGALGLVGMWGAVFADVGVALLAVANAMRVLKR